MNLTREQILEEPVGYRLNAWIERYVIQFGGLDIYPPYSTDISAAWEVAEKMRRDGKDIALFTGVVPGMWACAIGKLNYKNKKPIVDDTASLAICRAALLAKLEEANA